jgi:3-methyladenine DNA glycosylase AlkC
LSDYSLKVHFGMPLAQKLGESVEAVYPAFPKARFLKAVAARVEPLELKGRVALIAEVLRSTLPGDYRVALRILLSTLGPELSNSEGMFNHGYHLMPVAKFVEDFGLDHFGTSMAAMVEITKRHTAEYAIRPYLERHPQRVLKLLRKWALDDNQNVRRLVSEGTRSRLPWATRLKVFADDATPVVALLDLLKNDPSRFVQKSVANNLNDISKDHPKLAVQIAQRWLRESPCASTEWIVTQGLRSLVKQSDNSALSVLGCATSPHLAVSELELRSARVRVGEALQFTFVVKNIGKASRRVIVDYAIHYARANGRPASKVFRMGMLTLAGGQTQALDKQHSFRLVRTRKYFAGRHSIAIQLNGSLAAQAEFDLNL